jgi:nucleotide-binding universal stress UspA family protein
MPGILIGFDGSAHSDRALDWAVKEAVARHSPLTVIIVYAAGGSHWFREAGDEGGPGERARQVAREATEKALARLGDDPGISVTVRSVAGNPADVLLEAAEDVDMIVVGARGRGGFARLLVGSVSSQLVYHSPCPIVVVPPDRPHEIWRAVA